MKKMEPVRTAIIGCGKVGGIHAAALAGLTEAKLVAVADAEVDRAEVFGARYATRAYTEVESLLRDTRPEAVLVATPHPLHAAPALVAMDSGAHVLVEKPLAASLGD